MDVTRLLVPMLTALGELLSARHAEAETLPHLRWTSASRPPHIARFPSDDFLSVNFEKLEEASGGGNFGPQVDHLFRSIPIYVDGLLYAAAG